MAEKQTSPLVNYMCPYQVCIYETYITSSVVSAIFDKIIMALNVHLIVCVGQIIIILNIGRY